ncbi:MAG TPA: molybdopterin molybdenumtransferase MoeA [Sulfurihydrogenibium azorense]|uniref:Molybdopterin molybdenumtransferase n=1 Tax=Sulfurihydrogenibium azorense TaxID=309806 RepID=A0A832DAI4_9AQUI|nr:molybdopterin molybdenumtransferase MoeA [Sulfurihydrogenibium azorense]
MLSYKEALDVILDNTKTLGKEKVFLNQALDRVLAEDIVADRDNPPADNSGMDGFAVRYEDIVGASEENPVILTIEGESKAGGTPPKLQKGQAIPIYTGALIPEGADTVIQKELTKVENGKVYILKELKKGTNIRLQGEDYKKGDILIKSGKKIRPPEIGILASVNKPTVYVYQKPKVGIITTGDEILDIAEPITKQSQIRTSNTYSLYAQVLQTGAQPVIIGFAKDNPESIKENLEYAKNCDVLLTTGGVSVGEYDLVKDFVKEVLDVKIHFWKVSIKPGKPLVFGTWGKENEKLFFGIPGNPVASMVVFEIFVKPALKKMMGYQKLHNPTIDAILTEDFSRKAADRTEFIRLNVEYSDGQFYAKPFGKQASNILTGMVNANGLGIVDIDVYKIEKGSKIKVVMFDMDI